MRKCSSLLLIIVAGVSGFAQQDNRDYRSRTIYFLLADRFNPHALAGLRKSDPAVWRGTYKTLYADADVLIYERVAGNDVVLAAVNRGAAKDISLHGSLGFVPGTYRGLIADASPANASNYVRIRKQSSLVHLGAISALVLQN